MMPLGHPQVGLAGRDLHDPQRSATCSPLWVANRMGVDRAYVSGLELGQRNHRRDAVARGAGAGDRGALAAYKAVGHSVIRTSAPAKPGQAPTMMET